VYKGLGFFDADEIKDVVALIRFLADPSSSLRAAALLRSRFVRLSDSALTRLAPALAAALTSPELPSAWSDLDEEDRRVLEQVRPAVTRWLEAVDRIPPAELLDCIVRETGYAFELRGHRRRQAWENLKKIRSLVRRIQNSGYATIPRVAEHLMSLTGGDESNAVVEALDSINLMTVHAAKGLEFPIVFLVNVAKGASGPPRPVRVSVDLLDEPSVSVGPFISDTDEAERERERHETRRLLYVAVTRARDRLYLSSTLKEGTLVPGRGSLAEVLPESCRKLLSRAATGFPQLDTVGWTGVSAREYAWRVCRSQTTAAETRLQIAADEATGTVTDDFEAPPSQPPRERISTGELVAGPESPARLDQGSRSDRLLGIVIHRMFEQADMASAADGGEGCDAAGAAPAARAGALCRRALRDDELLLLADAEAFIALATEVWLRAQARPDVQEALRGRARFYEVPFSLAIDHRIVRGTIDCVVEKDDEGLLVVELKTGRGHPAHQRQLELYVRAARTLRGHTRAVSGALIYL
jgi:ATP-dependent exoDNAse (exonuclease V) beta subunit